MAEEDAAIIQESKKTPEVVDNSVGYIPKSVQLYNSIHEYADAAKGKLQE